MSEPESDRLDALVAEAIEHLLEDPRFDLEAFVRSHPGHEAGLRTVLERLRSAGMLPGASLAGPMDPGAPPDSDTHEVLLAELRRKPALHERYEVRQEIGRGGMGRVVAVFDRELRRTLAMKILRRPSSEAARGEMVARFLEEARITGQLNHQGIVPIHDLGLTEDGALYYTMRLIEGRRTLSKVFELAREGQEGWTRMRALDAILRACETVAYAHQRGVIHRDLKPSNIMVGPLGEVFVVDWGLSRVLAAVSSGEPRERPGLAALESPRDLEGSPFVTVQGQTLGTPYYMSPEQARGERDAVDARSDVYSMGAVLYEFLTGRPPYAAESGQSSSRELVDRIVAGPPRSISKAAPDEPAELVAICDKALQREPGERYPSITELAEDLRAYMEGRVVQAHERGAWAEARKWVRRNKPLATALAAAVALLVVGLVSSMVLKAQSEANAQRAETEKANARRSEDARVVLALTREADEDDLLWPAHPDRIPALESWLVHARELVDRLPSHRETLAEIRSRALPLSEEQRRKDRATHPRAGELTEKQAELNNVIVQLEQGLDGADRDTVEKLVAELGPEVVALTAEVESRRTWRFDTPEDRGRHDMLAELIENVEGLVDGLLDSEEVTTSEYGWSVPKRLAFAKELEVGFDEGGEYAQAWLEALPAIREAYPGLDLKPQMGLVPISPDTESGRWEFAHLMTGVPATRGADGSLERTEETGVVLVLLPGGTFSMGAQPGDPNGPNHDEQARPEEAPVHEVKLPPFFLSKYEMTQGQWQRLTGSNPSIYHPASELLPDLSHPVEQATLRHPVESVDWEGCRIWLDRAGLALPSEAQWEYGARAGTDTPWWTGDHRESLRNKHAANLADKAAAQAGARWVDIKKWPELDDGYAAHAPVGTFAPNAFGLHDVAGNVWEWCLDGYDAGFYGRSPRDDPVAPWEGAASRVIRGGGFARDASSARSANRAKNSWSRAVYFLGVRPARTIDP